MAVIAIVYLTAGVGTAAGVAVCAATFVGVDIWRRAGTAGTAHGLIARAAFIGVGARYANPTTFVSVCALAAEAKQAFIRAGAAGTTGVGLAIILVVDHATWAESAYTLIIGFGV